MKAKILSILAVLLFCVTASINGETINYIQVKTVYADGRITTPYGDGHCPFIFEGDRIYQYTKPDLGISLGTVNVSDGFRRHSVKNGRTIYYYYCSGIIRNRRASEPYWKYDKAIIVSSDRKTINVCSYDNVGNLKMTEVYKVPTAPGGSDFIE